MKNKVIIFCDFDGTITQRDVLDSIITDVYSFEKYKEVENKLLNWKIILVFYM